MPIRLAGPVTYGSVHRSLTAGGLVLTESSYRADTALPNHSHQYPYLCLVLSGGFKEVSAGASTICRAPMLTFHPAGENHSDRFLAAGARCLNVHLVSDLEARLRDLLDLETRPSRLSGAAVSGLGARLYQEYLLPDELSAIVLEGVVAEILVALQRARVPRRQYCPSWLARARELLNDRYRESFTLSQIAAELQVHPVHLARQFRNHHGLTIGDFIRRLRIEAACKSLVSGEQSLAEIALEMGFSDQSHFTRTFKKMTGMTPSRYRLFFSG